MYIVRWVGEKNDLLSAVASDDVVDCVKNIVEYLSCRVFGQAMYRHVTFFNWPEWGQRDSSYFLAVL